VVFIFSAGKDATAGMQRMARGVLSETG